MGNQLALSLAMTTNSVLQLRSDLLDGLKGRVINFHNQTPDKRLVMPQAKKIGKEI
jgi:hypothetical protein